VTDELLAGVRTVAGIWPLTLTNCRRTRFDPARNVETGQEGHFCEYDN
jgi:hypothetical protein